jgi:hypothetical protein
MQQNTTGACHFKSMLLDIDGLSLRALHLKIWMATRTNNMLGS